MRLKNKKTGEIVPASNIAVGIGKDGEWYDSLAELNEEWEDAPEDAIQVYIEGIQNVYMGGGRVYIDYATAKEAEESVRKLKAWKRLEDKGFRFNNWDLDADDEDVNVLLSSDKYKGNKVYDFAKDLDLLFGGEE